MTEETQKQEQVAQLQAEKGITTKEAEKEVAEKSIEEITGKSAVTAANEVREILEVYDALQTQNPEKIRREEQDTSLKIIKKFQEDLSKNKGLSDDLVKAGLGAGQLSVTASKMTARIDEVANEMETHGEAQEQSNKQENTIEDIKQKNPNITDQDIENMSPEEVERAASSGKQVQKNTPHLSLMKRLAEKGLKFLHFKSNFGKFFSKRSGR